jgi:phage-related baseplate assembly protein
MADEREFPDVDFVETDTNTILRELVADYEATFGRTLAIVDPVYQLMLWFASVLSQERSYTNIAAKRNLPRYSDGEYLDSLSEIFNDISRKAATPAQATFRFTLGETVNESVLIPEGTEITTTDGSIIFATAEEAEIPAGALFVDVDAECTEEGTAGNGYAIGTVSSLTEQIPYVDGVKNINVTANGTDEESDDELYNRGRESYEGYTTEGTKGAYRYLIMKHNPAVTDVYVHELSPGQAGITILMEDGVPSNDTVEDIQEYLDSDEIRGVTDHPVVSPASPVPYSIELKYYGADRPAVGGEELSTLVSSAVQDYIEWQQGKLGRRINPSKLIASVIRAGADRIEVAAPVEKILEANQCAVLTGTPVLIYGGVDD